MYTFYKESVCEYDNITVDELLISIDGRKVLALYSYSGLHRGIYVLFRE